MCLEVTTTTAPTTDVREGSTFALAAVEVVKMYRGKERIGYRIIVSVGGYRIRERDVDTFDPQIVSEMFREVLELSIEG